jgi:hypothetical protein
MTQQERWDLDENLAKDATKSLLLCSAHVRCWTSVHVPAANGNAFYRCPVDFSSLGTGSAARFLVSATKLTKRALKLARQQAVPAASQGACKPVISHRIRAAQADSYVFFPAIDAFYSSVAPQILAIVASAIESVPKPGMTCTIVVAHHDTAKTVALLSKLRGSSSFLSGPTLADDKKAHLDLLQATLIDNLPECTGHKSMQECLTRAAMFKSFRVLSTEPGGASQPEIKVK